MTPLPPADITMRAAPESLVNVLGVVYVHSKTADGGDIYFTRFGLPVAALLAIDNWYEPAWFEAHRERLEGTSAVYRVPTKEIDGKRLDLVVKNCRVGEDVPLETRTLLEFINTEFNSPWEEFSLVMEMREGAYGPRGVRIRAQEPLAIYVPPENMQIWQSGRSRGKINRIQARHPGIILDILKQYKLIYGWIHGRTAVEILEEIGIRGDELERKLAPITRRVISDLDKKGYAVADMKPAHIIISERNAARLRRLPAGDGLDVRRRRAELVRALVEQGEYSVIDYELLLRTPPHEQEVKYSRRHSYLDDQRDRFAAAPLPPHLRGIDVFGVPYIHGHAESTGGQLWVVGRNPRLFDYFLPERWRKTPSWRLSEGNEVYYTVTKDNIHIVWKTSRVGETPVVDPLDPLAPAILDCGFNSPFEEFGFAQFLSGNGVPTVYVRAIYVTGSDKVEPSTDLRRYESHRGLLAPDGRPILRENHNYITLRGYYNGQDSWVAKQEGQLCRPMDLQKALSAAIVTESEYRGLFDTMQQRLGSVGYDGSLLRGNDLLLAFDPKGEIVKDCEGRLEARICNFELLRKI